MLKETIKKLLAHESQNIANLAGQIDAITDAARICSECDGRIIITGLGKSGAAARKIAATLTSIGSPAIFLHPTEALHGELGVLSANDVVICISKSGRTEELDILLGEFKRWGLPIIGITADENSPLEKKSDVIIILPTKSEGDPLGIIPTTSVVCSIAIGDAIACGIMQIKSITKQQFRANHPGGSLGRRLTKVSELMHTDDEIPFVSKNANLRDAIIEITEKKFGTTLIMDDEKLLGILTDGDVRRAIQCKDIDDPLDTNVVNFATLAPKTIPPDAIAEEALQIFEQNKITSIVVMDNGKVVGFLHMHDILQRKII
ncbi:KpsF/GutQ family sugar-phosphate isomerase [bacterium]|nr:KpsF/GutQ family sugar-phosphate isomerase [bacterium]